MRPALMLLALIALSGVAQANDTTEALAAQVRATESAFAATMAKRDLDAFASFLAEEAVFFSDQPLRGKAAVIAAWKRFYEGPNAPFSWQPGTVEVLPSGTLAHSSGPVLSPKGEKIGTFSSVWRREADGQWKIVFDQGCEVCACRDNAPK